jgi:hypothetical protein
VPEASLVCLFPIYDDSWHGFHRYVRTFLSSVGKFRLKNQAKPEGGASAETFSGIPQWGGLLVCVMKHAILGFSGARLAAPKNLKEIE